MKKWLATIMTCLLLLVATSGAAFAHGGPFDRHNHYRHNFRNHHFDHHRDWRYHDGRIIIRANLADDVTLVWALPVE